jgi:hypothetical protein
MMMMMMIGWKHIIALQGYYDIQFSLNIHAQNSDYISQKISQNHPKTTTLISSIYIYFMMS